MKAQFRSEAEVKPEDKSNACTIESDTLSLVYPRDSTEIPTSDQIVRAISNMRAAALPSPNCCDNMKPYIQTNCPCLPGYQQILPIGGFDKAYFEGATNILALSCRIPFPPCKDSTNSTASANSTATATPPGQEPAAVAAAGPAANGSAASVGSPAG